MPQDRRRHFPPFLAKLPRLTGDIGYRCGLVIAWLAMIVVFSFLRPDSFFTTANFATIFGSQAVLLVLALALLIPLASGDFDLSVAGSFSIAMVLVGYLNVVHHVHIVLAILAALAVTATVGLFNALLVVYVRVSAIVITLGTGTVLIGAGYGISTEVQTGLSAAFIDATRVRLFGLQLVFYYGFALTILIWYVFSLTPLGRYIYFVGAGREVARLSGIRVDAIRIGSFVASGFLAGLAGVLLSGNLGSTAPNIGATYLLPAFAAVFLGATTIVPGRFNPWGTFCAVYFLATGITGLQLLGLYGWIVDVFYGASLVVAVTFSTLAGGHART